MRGTRYSDINSAESSDVATAEDVSIEMTSLGERNNVHIRVDERMVDPCFPIRK